MKGKAEAEAGRPCPPVLLPYQTAWLEDRSPVKVCEKSRRIGLSWCEAADDALLASSTVGMDVWYIGYNKDMALEFINDTAFWAKHYALPASQMENVLVEDEDKSILSYRIRFASGRRVTALSSRPSNLRGKQGKVVIDEAAFHDDLPGLFKAAIALLMWGGRVAAISTHFGDDNPFNLLVNEIRSGKKPYRLHRITLDDALAQGLYRRICRKLGKKWSRAGEAAWRKEIVDYYGDAADEELFCAPSNSAAAYLPRALVESCMDPAAPVLRWRCDPAFAELPGEDRHEEAERWLKEHLDPVLARLPETYPTWFGEDFGRSGDLTVIFPLQEQPGLTWRTPCVIELRNVPFRQQEEILFHLADRLPRFRGAAMDAGGNGQYLAEVAMQRYGSSRIRQVMLSTEWYREQMPRYKAAFEDRTIVIPRDADILDDHRAVRMEKGIAKVPEGCRTRGRDGGQRHGDAAVAGALALYAATQGECGPVEFKGSGKTRSHLGMDGF